MILLPLLTLNSQQVPKESTWYNQPFTLIATGMNELFYNFSHGVKQTTALYLNLIDIKKENASLVESNKQLKTQMLILSDLQNENQRLKNLMNFKQSSKMNLIGAQVVGRDLLTDRNTITINKGTQDGLKPGQAVITTEGVVGYVFRPQLTASHVMLITDRYSVVDGVVARTRSHGIVEGKAHNECALKYVEITEDVHPGDIVVTGGLDNIFPKGFPIARVEKVENKTYSISLKVDLVPFVDANKVEEVFIITDAANEDYSEHFKNQLETKTEPNSLSPNPADIKKTENLSGQATASTNNSIQTTTTISSPQLKKEPAQLTNSNVKKEEIKVNPANTKKETTNSAPANLNSNNAPTNVQKEAQQ